MHPNCPATLEEMPSIVSSFPAFLVFFQLPHAPDCGRVRPQGSRGHGAALEQVHGRKTSGDRMEEEEPEEPRLEAKGEKKNLHTYTHAGKF